MADCPLPERSLEVFRGRIALKMRIHEEMVKKEGMDGGCWYMFGNG